MAAELKDAFGVNTKLVAGGGGVFDVTVDRRLVFSKKSLKRFPTPGETAGLVKG